jgi:hypothetical protein
MSTAEQVESLTESIFDLLENAACHEAGHAVMRWLVGLPATKLTISEDGSGFCEGTGKRVLVDDLLRVTLAGLAAEIGYGVIPLDWERTRTADLYEALGLLARAPWLTPPSVDPNIALRDHFRAVCEELFPHAELVDDIARQLMEKREVSARAVAAFCREYRRRDLERDASL